MCDKRTPKKTEILDNQSGCLILSFALIVMPSEFGLNSSIYLLFHFCRSHQSYHNRRISKNIKSRCDHSKSEYDEEPVSIFLKMDSLLQIIMLLPT